MSDIKELAVAAWRLEKWLNHTECDRKMAAISSLRIIKKYIGELNTEIIDPIGSKFDPGLAVEVVNNEAEEGTSEEELYIIETITPYIYQNGELIGNAKVIIGTLNSNELNSLKNIKLSDNSNTEDDTKIIAVKADKDIDDNLVERIKAYAKNI